MTVTLSLTWTKRGGGGGGGGWSGEEGMEQNFEPICIIISMMNQIANKVRQ